MLKGKLHSLGFLTGPSETPIMPIRFDSETLAVEASNKLLERGFFVPAIRPPTVPKGTSRLRLTMSALHSKAEIESLVQALAEVRDGF